MALRLSLLPLLAYIVAADVTFKAHEIGYWNPLGTPGFAQLICDLAFFTSCPNIAAFESAEASSVLTPVTAGSGITSSADVIASVVSTIGAPSNVLSYYSAQNQLKLSLSTFTADNVKAFLTGDFSAVFSASGSAQVLGYAIDEVFEFRSADKSGVYKTSDTIVSTVSYLNVAWKAFTVDVTDTTTNITAVSVDGAHTFVWKMASQYATIENGAVLTPNSTKLDVTIKYPFKSQDTNIALRLSLVGASASGAVNANVEINNQQVTSGDSYLSWVGKASTNIGLVNVAATAGVDETASYFNTNKNILTTVNALAQAAGSANAYVKVTYFSFPVTSSSEYVYWDPAIGFGQNPAVNTGLSGWVIALIVIGSVAVVASVAAVVVIRIRRRGATPAFSSSGYA